MASNIMNIMIFALVSSVWEEGPKVNTYEPAILSLNYY